MIVFPEARKKKWNDDDSRSWADPKPLAVREVDSVEPFDGDESVIDSAAGTHRVSMPFGMCVAHIEAELKK